MSLGVNEHHQHQVLNFMRFARFQRGRSIRSLDTCFKQVLPPHCESSPLPLFSCLLGLLAYWSSYDSYTLQRPAHIFLSVSNEYAHTLHSTPRRSTPLSVNFKFTHSLFLSVCSLLSPPRLIFSSPLYWKCR